jgi:hypothetical protein
MRIPQHLKRKPTSVSLAAGEAMTNCIRDILVPLRLGDQYLTHLPLDVIPLNFDVVLGLPWLRHTCPTIGWLEDTLAFKHKGETIVLNTTPANKKPCSKPHVISALMFK